MSSELRKWFVVVLFLLAATWFFFPIGAPAEKSLLFSLRLALPAAVLALGGIGLLPWLMTVGFFFCAVGDTMGVLGSFEGQMGGFAVAHICFIFWLVKEIKRTRKGTDKVARAERCLHQLCRVATDEERSSTTPQGSALYASPYIYITPLCIAPLFFAAVRIIPAIHDMPIRVGCVIYALLLTGTMWTAWLRMASSAYPSKGNANGWALLTALGATLFLVSDFVLAWNKFVASIPNSRIFIMSTYYAALLLLFMGGAYKNKKKSHF